MLATIELTDAVCAFSSEDDQRYFKFADKRYQHLLDPGTGYPAQRTRSVTVIDHDPMLAEAAATTLFVATSTRWKMITRSMGVNNACCYRMMRTSIR